MFDRVCSSVRGFESVREYFQGGLRVIDNVYSSLRGFERIREWFGVF